MLDDQIISLSHLTFTWRCNHPLTFCLSEGIRWVVVEDFLTSSSLSPSFLCGTGSGKAELRAGWLSAASGGGPKGWEPMAGRSPEPSRTAGKCPAPTAPHQVVPNPIIHATTLIHTHTHSAPLCPAPAQLSPVQFRPAHQLYRTR